MASMYDKNSGNPYSRLDADPDIDYSAPDPDWLKKAKQFAAQPSTLSHRPLWFPARANTVFNGRLHRYAIASQIEEPEAPPQISKHRNLTNSAIVKVSQKLTEQRKNEISHIVRKLQRTAFIRSKSLHASGSITRFDPLTALDPCRQLEELGYKVNIEENLTDWSNGHPEHETAGILYPEARTVSLSKRQRPAVRKFTAAHELGHAVLHPGIELHRDRPVTESRAAESSVPLEEREADYFAALWLMPPKYLLRCVEDRFGPIPIDTDHTFAFNLYPSNPAKFLAARHAPLALERLIATAERFAGNTFDSLASEFGVSQEAMAIQLRSLNIFG